MWPEDVSYRLLSPRYCRVLPWSLLPSRVTWLGTFVGEPHIHIYIYFNQKKKGGAKRLGERRRGEEWMPMHDSNTGMSGRRSVSLLRRMSQRGVMGAFKIDGLDQHETSCRYWIWRGRIRCAGESPVGFYFRDFSPPQ